MDILLVQYDTAWLDPKRNLRRLDGMLEAAVDGRDGEVPFPDLIVLPEMFATGFCTDAGLCVSGWENTLEWMREVAVRYDAAVAGTIACKDGDGYFNRFFFVRPDGTCTPYDKRHLFTYTGENKCFTPGRERVIVEWRGYRILLQTCYDLRFPVFSRNRGDYELALYCADWPVGRIGAWDILLRARAVENACYTVGVNRVGTDPVAGYPGRSVVVGPRGEVHASAPDNEEAVIRCELSLGDLKRYREKFPVLSDADDFVLKN